MSIQSMLAPFTGARTRRPMLVIILLALAPLRAGAADLELAQAGRALFKTQGDAIATVRTVLMIGEDETVAQEMITESDALVVSADGLTLVPLGVLDPMHALNQLAGAQYGQMLQMMAPGATKLKEIKLILGLDRELLAAVVLRDQDLGVAVLRPIDPPAEALAFVDLGQEGIPEIMDTVLFLSRLGKVGGRQLSVTRGEIQAIMERPRPFYIPFGGFKGFGVTAFLPDGRLAGMVLLRMAPGGVEEMENGVINLSLSHMGLMPVILPAADLRELTDQARQSPAEKPADATEPAP